jgi:hypothetical protein
VDRISNALFGFQWRVTGRFGIDLYLHVGDVGHGINGQALVIP